MSTTINLTIDGNTVVVPEGTTVLDAAKSIGIKIPTLCHHPALPPEGACRVCAVEVKGARNLPASCVLPVTEGMEVLTHSPKVLQTRKTIVELLLSNHPRECLTCDRNEDCELRILASELFIRDIPFEPYREHLPQDNTNISLSRDPAKCILCGRCVRACAEIQGLGIYSFANRGPHTQVAPAFFDKLQNSKCVYCGQCYQACPTGAITRKFALPQVEAAIGNEKKHVLVQTAPSVRVGLGEALGHESGDIVTGKMVAALRQIGFDSVLDTNFSADLTIMEEAHEMLDRIQNKGTLPMFTSCCPSWVNFVEINFPELIPNLSTAKSPQQMFGAVAKTYYAKKKGIKPSDIVSVAVMPCTSKKFEADRPEMESSKYRDVDYVLTTTGLAKMIRRNNINFEALKNEEFDEFMGVGSGAGTIFGVTGGVMEAALRTAQDVIAGKEIDKLEFKEIRGLECIREAEIEFSGTKVKVVVAHTLKNARIVCDMVKNGNPRGWHFIEIMSCPGGCVNGGGQPITLDINAAINRRKGLFNDDKNLKIRKSHLNPEIKALYDEFLEKPNSHKAHDLLHTRYTPQDRGLVGTSTKKH